MRHMNWLEAIDFGILDFIQTHLRSGLMDRMMPFITQFGNAGWLWILLGLGFAATRRYRERGFKMLLALAGCLLVGNLTLKPLVARMRPFALREEMLLLIAAPTDFSFPSGHTMASFAAATVLFLEDRSLGIPALVLAALIAFSRLYLYVHFPSDVACGLVIGVLLGVLSAYGWNWAKRARSGALKRHTSKE